MHTRLSRTLGAVAIAIMAFTLSFFSSAPAKADVAASQSCGTVDLSAANSTDAARAFDCFKAAFNGCKPATLLANGVDAGVTTAWTFSTMDGGDDHGCSISELVERQTSSGKTTDSYLCRTVSTARDGSLVFGGCGTQKDVALRVTPSVGAGGSSAPAAASPKR